MSRTERGSFCSQRGEHLLVAFNAIIFDSSSGKTFHFLAFQMQRMENPAMGRRHGRLCETFSPPTESTSGIAASPSKGSALLGRAAIQMTSYLAP